MIKRVKVVEEKLMQITVLPDGIYNGVWSGNVIDLKVGIKEYELTTEIGVKGINIKVIIEVKNGIATFDTIKN